jgi:hypothetical protein
MAGQEQAREYADALERQFGSRPVIFYTNGYETWIWDDGNRYPPRPVQGFYTKDELRSLITRRASRQPLGSMLVNDEIVERYYQSRAISKVGERDRLDAASSEPRKSMPRPGPDLAGHRMLVRVAPLSVVHPRGVMRVP